ncbi:MAG TPA: hypothetical protein VM737_06720 [Gemmatimonadota bacterium]|nr:hypothetical protein [Gemmatimonadota bacterium]
MRMIPLTFRPVALATLLVALTACASSSSVQTSSSPGSTPGMSTTTTDSDPRVGLRPGGIDAEQAIWNLRLLSATPAANPFTDVSNSDLAFMGDYAIQGNYNGFQIWDISDPAEPTLRTGFFCPASQSDVSVYQNLLFVSGEGLSGRIDCGGHGVADTVSSNRLRGLRIFDISDIDNPINVGNVQTCRGSHTHSVLVDPNDRDNVYVYISGSAGVRSPSELPGCSDAMPDEDPNTALFRIEVIKVPLAHPEQAAVVSSPRIFDDLEPPPTHGESGADIAAREAAVAEARETGGFIVTIQGREEVLPPEFAAQMLDSIVEARGGAGDSTAADSAALRAELPGIIAQMFGGDTRPTGPTQCHDITVYPAIGLAGGACGGYGLLLDIRDPVHPKRVAAVADSNFSYWHSATFNNDGTKLLFSDEWGGGGSPKCRATDPKEWGANAIFTLTGHELTFESYYKLPVAQTPEENCVAHNGSLIPIPGRDVMVQGWYQGGISVFDWTDPSNPREIAFFDRGPMDSTEMVMAGSWSAYWYNGVIVSSEIARGLDVLELTPSEFLTQNEIDAARTVHLDYLNVQGQPQYVWPPSFALARAYLDQLARSNGMAADRILDARQALAAAERSSGQDRREALAALAAQLNDDAQRAGDQIKMRTLLTAVADLADAES